jgi:polyphosphate kinase
LSERVADDATHFFNALTGCSRKDGPRELLVAPINLRQRLEALILREIALQEKDEHGHLILKMNA